MASRRTRRGGWRISKRRRKEILVDAADEDGCDEDEENAFGAWFPLLRSLWGEIGESATLWSRDVTQSRKDDDDEAEVTESKQLRLRANRYFFIAYTN